MLLSFVSCESHGKAANDGDEQNVIPASVPVLGRRLFVTLLPFTYDFALHSLCFETGNYRAGFGVMRVRIYPK